MVPTPPSMNKNAAIKAAPLSKMGLRPYLSMTREVQAVQKSETILFTTPKRKALVNPCCL